MKNFLRLGSLFIFILFFASFISKDSVISFETALNDKKISMEILPTGGYCGNSINIKVKNLSGGKLNLQLQAGTVFVPDDGEEQTLITPQTELLVLEKNVEKLMQVNAYCTEATDRCPSLASRFTMHKTQNASLSKLVGFLDSLKASDVQMIQQSIWCVTDSENVSNVYSTDPKLSKAVRGYVCSLTGQKDPWYSTSREISVDRNHNIVSIPKEIKGELAFETAEPVELQGVVKDSLGNVLVTNPNKMSCPAGKIRFEFNLKVAGWKPGNYFVVYTNNGKEVINQPFSF